MICFSFVFNRFFNEIPGRVSTDPEDDSLTVLMKSLAIIIMIIYTATDILTHYKVAIMLGRPVRQNMLKFHKGGNTVVCPLFLDMIVFIQVLFTLYVNFNCILHFYFYFYFYF